MKKIIHCFFDDVDIWEKNTSSTFRICYNSWLANCPDYEIKIWHENSKEFISMLRQSRFLLECYKRKMWAFVSDYVRYYALYNYGGIYLDTDIQLVKNLDDFIDKPFFCSIENDVWNGKNILEPALIGGEKKHQVFKKVLDIYNSDEIFNGNFIAPLILTRVVNQISGFEKIQYEADMQDEVEKYYKRNGLLTKIKNYGIYQKQKAFIDEKNKIEIYPSEYFCPNWVDFKQDAFTKNTYAIHWNQSSWFDFIKNGKINEIKSYRYKCHIKRFLYANKTKIKKYFGLRIFNKDENII